jgi:hypothetical protein
MDEILVTLRQLGVGCYMAGVFMGAGFCDDLALFAPSRPAMQLMLEACERFGLKNNLIFSTDPDPNQRLSVSTSEERKDWTILLPSPCMEETCHGCLVLLILVT